MKKQFPALFLALSLCFGLAVPAFAAGSPPDLAITVSGPDGEAPRETKEFTLRSITAEDLIDGSRYSTLRTVFARSEETEQAALEDVYVLSPDDTVTVDGLRTGLDIGTEDEVSLYAWSDPDGDGVYDQRLFNYTSYKDDITVVPLSEPGPFTSYIVYENRYSRAVCLLGPDALTSTWYSNGDRSLPSSAALSVSFLIELFGPNTLVRLGVNSHHPDETEDAHFFSFFIPEGAKALPRFTDLLPWCEDAAIWAAQEGITNGYSAKDRFAPGKDCTQAQILTFLWRAEEKPDAAAAPITVAASYQGAINWAYEKGMIDDSFNPDAPCTRSQAVSYIWQARGKLKATETASFSDIDAGASYIDAVSWAVEKGVTKGYGGKDTFAPGRVCSRGEIVCFLYRAYND